MSDNHGTVKSTCVALLSILATIILGVSTSSAAVYQVRTSSELQAALDKAVAGDEIVLADGVYSGVFYIRNNAGTSSNPITVRAANRHKAIVQNSKRCDSTTGIAISRSHWILDGLHIRDQGRAVRITASNVTLRHNIIENFGHDAIRAENNITGVRIDSNVIAFGDSCGSSDGSGVFLVTNATKNILVNNIIYATGDNGYQAGSKRGYGVYIANNSDENLVQGNLLFANGGKGIFRILAGCTVTADRNLVRDNAFLWGEGGSSASDDCMDDSNQFLNNINYGNYHSLGTTKGNGDGRRGNHRWLHNLFYATEFTRIGYMNFRGGQGTPKIDNIFRNNVVYQNYQPSPGHLLMYIDDQAESLLNPGYNVFWAPGSTSSWFRNYTLRSTDIAAQPIFNNPAEGDFSLAPGSPGKGKGSNGADIGIEYNEYLKKDWLRNAFVLPTQQKDSLGTSVAFAVDPTKYYQVWFYIPESNYFTGTETFKIENQSVTRDLNTLTSSAIWVQPGGPARWITLGRHRATEGTLNISWSNSGSASKIFIRELPTANEAYSWITGATDTSPPAYQPASPSLAIPGRIDAESFNTGGEGVAYHDTTEANLGGAYRTSEAVDIKYASDGVGYTIGYIVAGEWLKYDVDITQTGNYTISLRVANGATTDGALRVEVDGTNVTGTISIPPTGSYNTETTVTGPTVFLSEGARSLRIYMEVGNFDLNWLEFTATSDGSAPAAPGPVTAVVE